MLSGARLLKSFGIKVTINSLPWQVQVVSTSIDESRSVFQVNHPDNTYESFSLTYIANPFGYKSSLGRCYGYE